MAEEPPQDPPFGGDPAEPPPQAPAPGQQLPGSNNLQVQQNVASSEQNNNVCFSD